MFDFLIGASPLFKICVAGAIILMVISAMGGMKGSNGSGSSSPKSSSSGNINVKQEPKEKEK